LNKSLFISKNNGEIHPFIDKFQQKKIDIIAHSFLSFEPIEFEIKSSYQIIFFSSPRSVTFFKTRSSIPSHVKIACIGDKTKALLEEMGTTVSFTRGESESLNNFAKSFKEWCGDKRVLFPISSISLKTISSQFPKDQKEELEIYSTEIGKKEIENCDVYVFTSPSNVEGFSGRNSMPESAKIISWGESTSRFLLENGGRVVRELKNSSIEELLNVI